MSWFTRKIRHIYFFILDYLCQSSVEREKGGLEKNRFCQKVAVFSVSCEVSAELTLQKVIISLPKVLKTKISSNI